MITNNNLLTSDSFLQLKSNHLFAQIPQAKLAIKNIEKVFHQINVDYNKQLKINSAYQFPNVMLVTKYSTIEQVFPFLFLGFTDLGENYVQGINSKNQLYLLLKAIFKNKNSFTEFLTLIKSNLNLNNLNQFIENYLDIETLYLLSNNNSINFDQVSKYLANDNFKQHLISLCHELEFLLNYEECFLNSDELNVFGINFPNITFHIIGNIQSRKVNDIIKFNYDIDTLSTIKLAQKLNRSREKLLQSLNMSLPKLKVKIQIMSPYRNVEESSGCLLADLEPLVDFIINNCSMLELTGLMFVASVDNLVTEYEFAYRQLEILKKNLNLNNLYLSMGMTDSIDLAMNYNTSQLRIGSAFFRA